MQTLEESGCLIGDVATIDCVPVILGNLFFWLFVLAGIVAVLFIIISGFKFVFSGGEAKQVEGARRTLTFSIIGLILIILSLAIVTLIGRVTGVTCLGKFGFTQCIYTCGQNNQPGTCPRGERCVQVRAQGGGTYICR